MNTRRILGDSITRTIIKLVIVSLLVGAAMSAFGIGPLDIVNAIVDFAVSLWESGWAALGRFGDWLILGASVVIPIFIVARLLSARGHQ